MCQSKLIPEQRRSLFRSLRTQRHLTQGKPLSSTPGHQVGSPVRSPPSGFPRHSGCSNKLLIWPSGGMHLSFVCKLEFKFWSTLYVCHIVRALAASPRGLCHWLSGACAKLGLLSLLTWTQILYNSLAKFKGQKLAYLISKFPLPWTNDSQISYV